LIQEKGNTDGYIAIIQPPSDAKQTTAGMLPLEQYKKERNL